MKSKLFYVSFVMTVLALSAVPLQQVNAKGFVFGGQPDLIISLVQSEVSDDNMYIPKENFRLVLDDMDKLPILFRSTIFPAIKEQLVKHESSIKDHYVESIGVVYNLNEDTMNVNKMQIGIRIPPNHVNESVYVVPVDEARMSVVKRIGIQISVFANLTNYDYDDMLKEIEAQSIHRVRIAASQAKEALNENRDALLTSVLEGEGSLTNKIRIRAISMALLDDIVRISISYPYKEEALVFIEETNPAIIMEFQANSITLGEPQIVIEHSSLNFPIAGRELIVQSELKNMVSQDMRFTYIVQVTNEDGIVVSLSSVEGSLASNESIQAALTWTPESAGTYEIKAFVWSNFASAPPLSPSRNISLTVMNGVMDVEQSYNNFPLTTYIGFPENKKRFGYCVPLDSNGETCDSFIGYKEYSLTLFSEERRDIKLNVPNVPKGMWIKLVPQQLNVGPEGTSARMIVAGGGGLPFTGPETDIQSLIIQAESNEEKARIGDLRVRTNIPTLTVLNSAGPIEFPEKIYVWAESSFRIFGGVYDTDEPQNNSLSVNLSVLGLLQEGKIIPMPSWLEVDIPNSSFSLNASEPHYFVTRAVRTSESALLGDHTIVIEEIIDGQRFTQNLQIRLMEPARLGS